MNERLQIKKYVTVSGILGPQLTVVCARYAKAQDRFNRRAGDPAAPNSHSVYGDLLMEALLESLTPAVEQAAGLSLWPTYSYYRVYCCGETLLPHRDRSACEISVSVCLGYDYKGKDYQWPIGMERDPVVLQPGDGVIYLGCEIEHWRAPLHVPQGGWHAQLFLHYVDRNGPKRHHKFDRRPGLYCPARPAGQDVVG